MRSNATRYPLESSIYAPVDFGWVSTSRARFGPTLFVAFQNALPNRGVETPRRVGSAFDKASDAHAANECHDSKSTLPPCEPVKCIPR